MRYFGWGEKKPDIGPLTQEKIDKLPLVLFVPADNGPISTTTEPDGENAVSTVDDGYPPVPHASIAEASTSNAVSSPTISDSPTSESTSTKKRRRRQLRRLFIPLMSKSKGKQSAAERAEAKKTSSKYMDTPYPLHPLPPSQSTCPICLCDYEPPPRVEDGASDVSWEPLRLLPCRHAIHKDCLDPWLVVSGRCPVCQRAVHPNQKGKSSGDV